MADSSFRVLLDLTNLYIENFKYVWINVSPRELKTIADFKSSILQKINLDKGDIKLFVRDGLLLDEETVLVLREDDTVKVQYDESFQSSAVHNSEKGSKRCSKKRNLSECSISGEVVNSKKKKVENDVSKNIPDNCSVEKSKEKKKKCKKSHSTIFVETVDLSENFGENVHGEIQSHKKKCNKEPVLMKNSTIDHGANENYDAFFSFETENPATELHETNILSTTKTVKSNDCTFNADSNLISELKDFKNQQEKKNDSNEAPEVIAGFEMNEGVIDNNPKRKRKRRKKRKNADSSVSTVSCSTSDMSFSVSNETNLEKQHKSSQSTIFNVSGNMDSLDKSISFKDKAEENVKRKHIIYKHETENDIVFRDDAKEVHKDSTKTFAVKSTLSIANAPSFKDYPRVSTPNQSNGCDKPNWCVSLMEGRGSMKNNEHEIPQKEPIKICTVRKPLLNEDISCQSTRKNKLSPEMKYQDLPALKSIPEIGAHIAYKTLELDESYSPTISDYREGIVKSVNPDTDEIEIEFFVGVVKPGRTGKFENLKEDETPSPEVKTCDILKWSSILSPKRLSKLPN